MLDLKTARISARVRANGNSRYAVGQTGTICIARPETNKGAPAGDLIEPVSRFQESLVQIVFWASRRRSPVITPTDFRG